MMISLLSVPRTDYAPLCAPHAEIGEEINFHARPLDVAARGTVLAEISVAEFAVMDPGEWDRHGDIYRRPGMRYWKCSVERAQNA